ncbi:MAG: TerD family protein [Selenomonadaceae bacterium]|nr:TerD family protein [Selenomonadaceae bacterium]
MAVSLKKGQKVDLTKTNPGLKEVLVGLGWDVKRYDGGSDFDLDASVFMLGESGKVPSDGEFIFYGNKKHSSGSVEHMGDNLTGAGEGDDEQIKINLAEIPANIAKIDFTVTIYEADQRKQNFGQVENAFIRVVNAANGEELIRYDLTEDFSIETAVVVGELYRHGGEWKFNAIGSGFEGGLAALGRNYGVNVG